MQAIVLVGGEGTRLRPLTFGTPKPMVPIAGVPFLARTVERLHEAGIDEVIFAAGYMPQAIVDYFGDGSAFKMKITYVIEAEPLGTAGALKNVERYIHGPFFVLNGDVLTSLDLRAMMEFHRKSGGLGVLHLIRVEDPSAFGCVVHDATGRISAFVEKPPKGSEPTDEVNAGTYLLEPSVFAMIPAGRNVSIERETFPAILVSDQRLYAYTTNDYWIDLGRPEHYLSAHRDILSGAMPLALSSDHDRSLPGEVYVEAGAHIDPTTQLGANVVVGRGCSIGARVKISDSVLWDEVVVGDDVEIESSIIASRARIGAHATIGAGTVIGHDVVIEPGTHIAPDSRIGGTAAAAR